MKHRTILITGAAGRFGEPLANELEKRHRIVRMDHRKPEEGFAASEDRRFIIGSITDPATIAEAIDGVDTVIHSAAVPSDQLPFEKLVDTNVAGTFNMLEAAGQSASVEQFVFLSSLCWHGIGLGDPVLTRPQYLPIDEEHPSVAISPYGMSKVQGELWCQAYAKRFGKPVVAVRPGWIVPPYYEGSLPPRPPRKTPWLMDHIATRDLIDGIERILDYDPPDGFDAFLFSADDQMSTMPSVELAEYYFPGIAMRKELLEACDGYGSLIHTTHARERLGWEPRFRCNRNGETT